MKKRILCLLLTAALLLGLVGCHEDPDPTDPDSGSTPSDSTEQTEATDPSEPALEAYRGAVTKLAGKQELLLEITTDKNLSIGGDSFTTSSSQEITYLGLGSEDFRASVSETIDYTAYETDIEELYAGGMAYATVYDSNFSCEMTAEEFTSRYLPVILIDETLYGSCTMEEADGETHITFTDAQALEAWIATDATTLISAEAEAVLNADGELHQFHYQATYANGGGTASIDVTVDLTAPTDAAIAAPDNAADYTPLSYLDGPRMLEHIYGVLLQAESITFGSMEQIICDAASVYSVATTTINSWGSGSDLMTTVDYYQSITDYYNNETYEYELAERYENKKYTVSIDGGSPTTDRTISADTVWDYVQNTIIAEVYDCSYFTEATCTDLGSLLLIEFTGNSELGQVMNEYINSYMYGDAGLLDSYASAFRTEAMEYYIGVDKYLGLPTSIGVHFNGCHTIDGYEYYMDLQLDQSIYLASLSSYESITEQSSPDTEPEQSATPLFYHVTGPNGEELWLLGTIHVGDSRTGYLPQEIYDAFDASDALAVECNVRTFEDLVKQDEALQLEVSKCYYYSDGSTIADHIEDAELYDLALKMMKATGNYSSNAPYLKLSLWAQLLDNYFVQQAYTLSSDKGVDNRLLMRAEASNKTILEVESNLFQLQMFAGWSEELSLLLLTEALSADFVEYMTELNEMYELWCSGDEAALTEYLTDDLSDLTDEELKLYEEYNTAMSTNRDKNMVSTAISYLESGDTVFFAVGLAHVLSDSGLVNGLRDAGYTVELVTFE